MPFTDGYWWSNDGLRLHYRDYAGRGDRPAILCLPGLTRNARDFHDVAERLSPEWRVIAVDFRGRGESGYAKDPMSYVPLVYVQDVERLLDELKMERVVSFGTSLGGIVTMILAGADRTRLAGALLNDVGPELEASGLERIRSYVGRSAFWPTWIHAARALGEANGDAYPLHKLEDWLAMAKRLYRLTSAGRIAADYDLAIAEPFRLPGGASGIDLWPAFDALSEVPTLLLRGALSDLLSNATVLAMTNRVNACEAAVIPDVGHPPTLSEPAAIKAIDKLLTRIAA